MATTHADTNDNRYITLCSGSVEGSLENVKSDFMIPLHQPMTLPAGKWYVSLQSLSYRSSIINYDSTPEDETMEEGPQERRGVKRPLPSEPLEVDCQYALTGLDGDGFWRKETPTEEGRPLHITFRNPDDKEMVAEDINRALAQERDTVKHGPPALPSTRDMTTLQFFRWLQDNTQQKMGPPILLEAIFNRCYDVESFFAYITIYCDLHTGQRCDLKVDDLGYATFTSDWMGFIVSGRNRENARRMLRVFGVEDGNDFFVTAPREWKSPKITMSDKEDPNLARYNLQCVDYGWWTDGTVGDKDQPNEYMVNGNHEGVKINFKVNNSSGLHETNRVVAYKDIEKCGNIVDLCTLLFGDKLIAELTPEKKLRLTTRDVNDRIFFSIGGMPCDMIPKAFGVPWYWARRGNRLETVMDCVVPDHYTLEDMEWVGKNESKMDYHPRMSISDIVHFRADKERNAVIGEMTYSVHVQGFSMAFQEGSPFYPWANMSICKVTENSYRPPSGHLIPFCPLENSNSTTDKYNDRLHMEPYKLKGLLPIGSEATMPLKMDWRKPVNPTRGFHISAYAKNVMAQEAWSSVYSKDSSFAMNDIVGDLPSPASYKTTADLVTAFYSSFDKAIAEDVENIVHGLSGKDIIKITYDNSTSKYTFECGQNAAAVTVTLHWKLAHLFGLEPETEDTDLVSFTVGRKPAFHDNDIPPSKEVMAWTRPGHPMGHSPWLNTQTGDMYPQSFTCTYPVTPSLGNECMYVACNLIDDKTVVDGKLSNVLAIVAVDWSKDTIGTHDPTSTIAHVANTHRITAVRLTITDRNGNRIKFMSNDNNPVNALLQLSRKDG